jgi:uncharacterized protein (TIGR03067 family)
MRPSLLIVGLCLILFGFAPLPSKPNKEKKSDEVCLQGTWQVVEGQYKGKPIDANLLKILQKVVFTRDRMIISPDEAAAKRAFKFKLDATTKPKTIDLLCEDGPFKDKTAPGLYELEGDTLKLCMGNSPETKRPKELHSPVGSDLMLLVFKRAKP